jgi:hypothetical protein
VKPKRGRAIRRFFGWFWRGEQLKAARNQEGSERRTRFENLARTAAELGRRALEPVEPIRTPNPDLAACDLYAQSVYWCSLALCTSNNAEADGVDDHASAKLPIGTLWQRLDRAALTKAAGSEETLNLLAKAIDQETFVERAQLPLEQQAQLARALRRLAEGLLAQVELPQRAADVIIIQRISRIALVFAMVGIIVALSLVGREVLEARNDLARDRPWRASSLYFNPGCVSPSQSCPESPNYFVHTNTDEPAWVEFDLGKVQSISALRIDNRKECCFERAAPLTVEVSTDGKTWKEVARRKNQFNTWRPSFPTVQARKVRVVLPKRGILHLSRVRILP